MKTLIIIVIAKIDMFLMFNEDDETFTFLFLNFIFNDLSYTDVLDRDNFDINFDVDSSSKNYISD